MLKIAVIGTGIIGAEHLKAINSCPDVSLVAVCDVCEERAKAFAETYKVPYFIDYKDIPIKTDADAVILNLPHKLHCESAVFFLEAGLHVFLEKPMANTLEECDKIISAQKRSNKKLVIGHLQRFFTANRIVKEYIDSGEFGKLFAINELRSINYFSSDRPAWFLNKETSGGGIVMNYGAHAIDKIFYITGSRIEDISSSLGNIANDKDIEGHAQFFFKLSGGISATVTFSGYSSVGYETTYFCEKGALKVTNGRSLSICRNNVWETVNDMPDEDFMLRQLIEFEKITRGEQSESPDGEYGREIILAIQRIYNFD